MYEIWGEVGASMDASLNVSDARAELQKQEQYARVKARLQVKALAPAQGSTVQGFEALRIEL